MPDRAGQDPLEPDAPRGAVDDPALRHWFLTARERGNPASDLRLFTTGNHVEALVDGARYFTHLYDSLMTATAGDHVYLLEFRGDKDELLAGPGSEVGRVLGAAAERGVHVFGLLWRSHPEAVGESEEANAEFTRTVGDHGGHVMLDGRTRRAGSHHQKLVIVRHPDRPDDDVAYVGGIDLAHSRRDERDHHGDPQPMEFPDAYGSTPPWHDIQAAVRGPAVQDLEHTFRERWYGSHAMDVPSPLRRLYDRGYHAGALSRVPLPDPLPDGRPAGPHAVQVLRTYPARLRRYPFAPLGERSIAHAYRRVFARARRLVYLEDQYLWSRHVASVIAAALHATPSLRVIVVVPRHPDKGGRLQRLPTLVGREDAIRTCAAAGGERFAVYDLENHEGTPVYVHAKMAVVDDVWAMIGSDNLNRRSWTHDSELSISVLDRTHDSREPRDPAGLGDHARRFARDLRIDLLREHLDRDPSDVVDLIAPDDAFRAVAESADRLDAWHRTGGHDPRPPGRLRRHRLHAATRLERLAAWPLYSELYDPDGRAWRDRLLRRP